MMTIHYYIALFLLLLTTSCSAAGSYRVIDKVKQDARIFTQGLDYEDAYFFISSGLYGASFVRVYNSENTLVHQFNLPAKYFAEGIVHVGDTLYLLTWKAGALLILDAETLEVHKILRYRGEGWGITFDGEAFLMSDGSNIISRRDILTFETIGEIAVTHKGKRQGLLNELEYACDALWANVWFSDDILKIDPATGEVLQTWDLSTLRKSLSLTDPQAVLNGIAYDTSRKAFWISGKFWPQRFLVKLDKACD